MTNNLRADDWKSHFPIWAILAFDQEWPGLPWRTLNDGWSYVAEGMDNDEIYRIHFNDGVNRFVVGVCRHEPGLCHDEAH